MEALFKQWRRMPDWHEANAAREELLAMGVFVPPGEGWDGPPVAV